MRGGSSPHRDRGTENPCQACETLKLLVAGSSDLELGAAITDLLFNYNRYLSLVSATAPTIYIDCLSARSVPHPSRTNQSHHFLDIAGTKLNRTHHGVPRGSH